MLSLVKDTAINPGPLIGFLGSEGSCSFGSGSFSGTSFCSVATLAGFLGGVGLLVLVVDPPIRCPAFICCSRSRKDLYLVAS